MLVKHSLRRRACCYARSQCERPLQLIIHCCEGGLVLLPVVTAPPVRAKLAPPPPVVPPDEEPEDPLLLPPEGRGDPPAPPPPPPTPPPTLLVVVPLAIAAKSTAEPGVCVMTPAAETVKLLPAVTVVVSPLFEVNVALPSVTLNFTPHSSGFCPGRHGMTIISPTAAIDIVAGSTNKPAKMSVLVHLCLNMTRRAPSLHLLPSQ